jgi:hypothetical protein
MVGHELAVQKLEAADAQPRNQPGQRDLGRVRHRTEHALAEEGAAQLDAVKAANQLLLVPHLHGVGVAQAVKFEHRLLDFRIDPRLIAVSAASDDPGEVAVPADLESARAQRPAERPRQMEAFERDDRAAPRLDPEQVVRIAAVGHRKDPGGIALEQQARVETNHDGFIGDCRGRENLAVAAPMMVVSFTLQIGFSL